MDATPETNLSEQIKKINGSAHLSETEKNRLISELLKQITPQSGRLEFNPAGGYVLSFLLPPLGLFIGGRYLLRYGEDGVKPGITCIALTCISLLIQFLLFKNMIRALFSGLSSLKIPGM
ncbi:MAG: hypothetical protein NTY10_03700 [Candidatus Omnitrophica bacterium]|nr:hypothetical protein [Candidatus Omnitrophota bacterium]